MRIVMPLFDFINGSGGEFAFADGVYALRRFDFETDVPKADLPGLSKMDLDYIRQERWALVFDGPNLDTYREDINLLLLSFKIQTLARPFIKYRLCATDLNQCSIVNERMTFILPDKSERRVNYEQLEQVNIGFQRLKEMYLAGSVSNRLRNAVYFMYCAYFMASHALPLFVLLFTVLEALFSKEIGGAATKTVCHRASSFLGLRPGCSYSDIERLYQVRSELVHGRRDASESDENRTDAHALEFVVTECMKKMLSERIYLKYKTVEEKESYFNLLRPNL